MKIIKTTMIEFADVTGMILFPENGIWDSQHENFNKDINILVTNDGIIYKENSTITHTIHDMQFVNQIMSNDKFKHRYSLNEYNKTIFNELDQYINNEDFMQEVSKFLSSNKTFSKIRLGDALNMNKTLTNKLVIYLIENKFVIPYYSSFKVII